MLNAKERIRAMFSKMARDADITGEVGRVLYYFLGKLDFENFIHVAQADIAQALGLQKSNVSRAVRILCEKQIILKGPKTGRTITYRLNPDYGWKGKDKNMNTARFTVIQGGKGSATGKSGEGQ